MTGEWAARPLRLICASWAVILAREVLRGVGRCDCERVAASCAWIPVGTVHERMLRLCTAAAIGDCD
eukprot:2681529-Alexandrium_andersonii.AAC.1